MPVFADPVVALENVRLRAVSLSSVDLDVMIRVENKNPVGVTLKEIPFSVFCCAKSGDHEIATGNTGRAQIPAQGSTVLTVPVRSQNAALAGALSAFLTSGKVRVTIKGTAVLDAVLFSWSIPFEKTLPVTMEQIADELVGRIP